MKTRIGKFFRRPDVQLLALVIIGHAAANNGETLIGYYRDGVPVSPLVAFVHVIALLDYVVFFWLLERLAKRLELFNQVQDAARAHLARKRAERAA
jgi:hypothetical protein